MATVHVICVGGNSEASFAGGPQSLRQLSDGPNGGRLREILNPAGSDGAKIDINCTYYSWTGTPRENTWWIPFPVIHWFGASHIAGAERHQTSALIIIGWSNGGDTAYNLAKKIGKVDALFTLDPVSRITSAHWLPFNGTFSKPVGVRYWFHAFTHSSGFGKLNPGNIIAATGGPWNSQPRADVNVMVSGNHGDTIAMLTRLTQSEKYRTFLRSLSGGA